MGLQLNPRLSLLWVVLELKVRSWAHSRYCFSRVLTLSRPSVLPHVVNAAILTSAFSAGSSLLFCSSRILYGLAIREQAPHFLTRCTESGLPRNAVLVSVSNLLHSVCFLDVDFRQSIFSLLSFLKSSSGAETVFRYAQPSLTFNAMAKPLYRSWLVNISTTAGFLSWLTTNFTYIYFCTSSRLCRPHSLTAYL